MTEALARPKSRIDDPEELDRLVKQIVAKIDPVAIYLFGSRARGEADEDSDYDLMVVIPDERMTPQIWEDLEEARRSADLSVELIPARAGGFAEWRHEVGTLSFEVSNDGIRLYPRSRRRIWIESSSPPANHESMNRQVVASWLRKVERDLRVARLACDAADPMPDQAAYHVQQAAEKLTKAALVANEIRPRKGHVIKASATRLPAQFVYRSRFLELDRFSDYVWAHRYPEEDLSRPPRPLPSVAEARAWLDEVEALKADFERWLSEREAQS
jgi:predicted nucleotidyltransferase/HEPN domain-containing protein